MQGFPLHEYTDQLFTCCFCFSFFSALCQGWKFDVALYFYITFNFLLLLKINIFISHNIPVRHMKDGLFFLDVNKSFQRYICCSYWTVFPSRVFLCNGTWHAVGLTADCLCCTLMVILLPFCLLANQNRKMQFISQKQLCLLNKKTDEPFPYYCRITKI